MHNYKIGVQGEESSQLAIGRMMRKVNDLVPWNNQGFLHNLIEANGVELFQRVFNPIMEDILSHRANGHPFDKEAALLNSELHKQLPIWPTRKGIRK